MSQSRPAVVVVGGGLAGLSAASYAARDGATVTLIEAVSEPGGRARTRRSGDFAFNMGAHALYRGGPAEAVLGELGVPIRGRVPDAASGFALCGGRLHRLPAGPLSLLTTSLLGARDKLALGRALARLPGLDPEPWNGRSVREYLDESFRSPQLRALFAALVRLTTYVHAPERMSAGAALSQLQQALGPGVVYLDDGWQSLVDGLARRAREAGVEFACGARARALESEGGRLRVRLADDRCFEADSVVLALGPSEASALLAHGSDPQLSRIAERSQPVRAAALDVGLARLPDARCSFALGVDEPTYVSLHSRAAAGLAPEGGANFQLIRYLAPDEKPERAEAAADLEGAFDACQPGWRDEVREHKLLLDLRVAHAIPTPEAGGLPGRPRVDALAAQHPGVFLAGDWVGPHGWLADASFASGRTAGRAAGRGAGCAAARGARGAEGVGGARG